MLVLLAIAPVSWVEPVVMQAGGKGPRQYNGTIDAWKKIAANEGSKAFFKVPNPFMSAVPVMYARADTMKCSGTCLPLINS
jgi:hypothetical protein